MTERIEAIWKQLESNNLARAGLFKIRYSEESKCDVYLGQKYPESHRMIILRVPFHKGKEFSFRYEFMGLKFHKVYDPDDSHFLLLNLVLVDNQLRDIFNTLTCDLICAIVDESDIKVILRAYTNRLIKWQSLFERFKQQGLSPDQQRGLYGELRFLKRFLTLCDDYRHVIDSWLGPQKAIRDFQFGRWAIEVKTTHGNNHQKIGISSERQLDPTNLDNLYLSHCSLEIRQQSGETLSALVDSIIQILSRDFSALSHFRNKLLEAGYFDHHIELYQDTGYLVRQEAFYKVEGTFPRIEEGDIRNGIGDVKYSIIVSHCSEFLKTEQQVFETLRFDG